MATSSILIKNGYIVTMDREKPVLPKGDVFIEDDKIVAVGKSGELHLPSEPEVTIDASHKLVMPGYVNVHTHLPSIFVRGVYGVVAQGLTSVLFPLKAYIKPEDMYTFGLVSIVEALYGGSTTIVESYNYLDHFARAVEECGIRAVLGEQIVDADLIKIKDGIYDYKPEQGDAAVKRGVDLIEKWSGKAEGRISTIVAPLAPDMTTPETYLKCKEVADKFGLDITTHLSQSWGEVTQVKKKYGLTPTEHLDKLGLMDDRLSGAHCTYISDKERALMARKGAKILHCPRPYATGGVSNPLIRNLGMGIEVGLGTDNVYHSMNETIRVGLFASRFHCENEGGYNRHILNEYPTYHDMLKLATLDGAKLMKMKDKIGSLEPGKRADVIIYDLMNPHMLPTVEPISSIVLYGTSSDVDTVIIDGKLIKENKKFNGLNVNKIIQDAQTRSVDIWQEFFKDNPSSRKIWEGYLPFGKSILE